jgi:autotransporter-associated beta strand protein
MTKQLLRSRRLALAALLWASAQLAPAQVAVFNDTFSNGSKLDTNNPVLPTANNATYYEVIANKGAGAAGDYSCAPSNLSFGNAGSSAGAVEVQAVFTQSPVTLNNPGDTVTFTVVYTNGYALTSTNGGYVAFGLFNSGQVLPLTGYTNVMSSTLAASGGAQGWEGYSARLLTNNASESIQARTNQLALAYGQNQDVIIGGSSSGSGYKNGVTVSSYASTLMNPLTYGAVYTNVLTITMLGSNTNSLAITNSLYSSSGTLLSAFGGIATNSSYLTNSFDALAIGNYGPEVNAALMNIALINISETVSGTPGPLFTVTGGGTTCQGDLEAVGLSGSVSTNIYRLYTNGVYAGQALTGNGSALTFNPETVLAVTLTNSVLASNPVTAFTGFMSGSVLVAPTAPPVITNQPVAAVAATNSIAVFTVGASGGGLGYQWYKNGTKLTDGAEFAGSATATLVINPATTADVAAYYCQVTNTCGSQAISTTNNLTLDTPANLAWQGGNPNNVWDLATTANFNYSPATVFHNGDVVNLTDNTGNTQISIVGSEIAPSLVNLTANGENYSLSGAALVGPGSMLLSGGATLTVSNANNFSGGTVISNGTLAVANYDALGTGPVTLAGGTLNLLLSGGSTTGLTNNLNVVGNSTLEYNVTGTYGAVLFGGLSGNSGAALTINLNNSSYPATARLRLYTPFTNNAAVVLATSGTTPEIAPYAATGQQVFNGPISGSGHFLPRGTAPVVFGNTNTFEDGNNVGVIISGGSVGIGADSVVSSGTLVSSAVGLGTLEMDPSLGNATVFAVGGSHTVANPVAYVSTTNMTFYVNGSNNLTFAGQFAIGQSGDNVTNRTWNVGNTGATLFTGAIVDKGVGDSITLAGGGSVYLDSSANTFSGGLTNGGGLLAGTGTITAPVVVQSGSSLGGGDISGLGTLTINSNLTLAGNLYIRVNKALTQSNDQIFVTGTLANSGTGTVTVTNLGATAYAVGDRFPLFNKAVSGGAALTVTGGGVTWSNGLAVDGSIRVLAVASSVPPISYLKFTSAPVIAGTSLTFSGTNTGGGNVYLLTTTNLAKPVTSWTPVWTNSLTGTGTFTTNLANVVNQALGQQFFLMSTNN